MKELKNKKLSGLVFVLCCFFFLVSVPVKAAEVNQSSQLQLTGVDASNGLEVVWAEGNSDNGYGVYYSKYTNGAWQQKQIIIHSDNRVVTPCIGGSGNQGSMLVWSEKSEDSIDLYYSMYKNGAWSSPKKIDTNLVSNLSPSLLVDGNNRIWLAWTGSDGSDDDIYYSTWNGTVWTAPVQVNDDNDTPDIFPVLGMGASGKPWIQWYGWEDGKYTELREDWNGSSFEGRQTMTGRAVKLAGFALSEAGSGSGTSAGTSGKSAGQDTGQNTSVTLPTFLSHPERATIHILQSKSGMQTLAVRDLSAE